jgi:hypothetical protein
MYPLNEMLADLHAAGFTTKELTAMKEAQISYLYESLLVDKEFWQRRLQKPDPLHAMYPDPNISLTETFATMTAAEKAALRARLAKA